MGAAKRDALAGMGQLYGRVSNECGPAGSVGGPFPPRER